MIEQEKFYIIKDGLDNVIGSFDSLKNALYLIYLKENGLHSYIYERGKEAPIVCLKIERNSVEMTTKPENWESINNLLKDIINESKKP